MKLRYVILGAVIMLILIAIFVFFFGTWKDRAWAGEMSDAEYMYKLQEIVEDEAIKHTRYPWNTYLKYCGYTKTPGGFWRCQEALDRDGIPKMGCSNPTYLWVHENGIGKALSSGWKQAPLKFDESIINEPYAPRIYWFYRCE